MAYLQGPAWSIEVFYASPRELQDSWNESGGEGPSPAGYYWWACYPGCLPDGEPMGPFDTEEEARENALESLDD